MKRTLLRLAAPVLFALSATAQTTGELALTCANPTTEPTRLDRLVEPATVEESARLQYAAHGTRRLTTHELQVVWANGQRLFKDEPPFDEPMAGIFWVYCGYSSPLKLHLVGKNDANNSFIVTGDLVDDNNGSVLPGGEAILFSPNRKLYLAYEQPYGQDGETLKLYSREGHLLWQGYNGFLSPDGKIVLGEFEHLHWDSRSRLVAEIKPVGKQRMTVILVHRGSTKWEWTAVGAR
jgi:hypothetical protein